MSTKMPLNCFKCEKVYLSKVNLDNHLENQHGIINHIITYSKNEKNFKCLEGCDASFHTNSDLRFHLQNEHEIPTIEEIIHFKDMDSFQDWLLKMKRENNIQYVKAQGSKNTKNGTSRIYYHCTRSSRTGNWKTRKTSQAPRQGKVQGSRKLPSACTSQIILSVKNNIYRARYYKNHYGHRTELQHLPLLKEDRDLIAGKLAMGFSTAKILDDIRHNIDVQNPKRIDLITSKDLYNIKRAFKIKKEARVHNSFIDGWTEVYEKDNLNQVLLFKRQGDPHDLIDPNDFCLITMNETQGKMLKTFGNNIIAIDSTRGIHKYDFELTTVMVIDEFGEGFPGACMITNSKDAVLFELFFSSIETSIGKLNPSWFLSDCTNVFYNAWTKLMHSHPTHLYCSWQLDRAWKDNLNMINNLEKRHGTYRTIKLLQRQLDEKEFHNMLNYTITKLCSDSDTELFGMYFKENYASNFKKWAYCFRKHSGINTNMYLDSMHNIIKYLGAKKIKRLDKTAIALNKFVHDKIVDRIQKKIGQIKDSHRTALAVTYYIKEDEYEANTWQISSENYQYTISMNISGACCKQTCEICEICTHQYSCTCPDFSMKKTICKHIHYFILKQKRNRDCVTKNEHTDINNILSTCDSSVSVTNLNLYISVEAELHSLKEKVTNGVNTNILKHVYSTIKRENSLIQATESTSAKTTYITDKINANESGNKINNKNESIAKENTLSKNAFNFYGVQMDHTYNKNDNS